MVLFEGMFVIDVILDFIGGFWFILGFVYVGYIDVMMGEVEMIWFGDDGEVEVIGVVFVVGFEGVYVLMSQVMYMFGFDEQGVFMQCWCWCYGDLENLDFSMFMFYDEGWLVIFFINYGDGFLELVVMCISVEMMLFEECFVCCLDMFELGKSAIQNMVVVYGWFIIVENNFGGAFYEVGDFEFGFVRVDVCEDYSGCDIVWEDWIIFLQVLFCLLMGDGYIWLYVYWCGEVEDVYVYYLMVIDFEIGEVEFQIFVVSGKWMDNFMFLFEFFSGGVMVGGVCNGIISVCDFVLDDIGMLVCIVADGFVVEMESTFMQVEVIGCVVYMGGFLCLLFLFFILMVLFIIGFC